MSVYVCVCVSCTRVYICDLNPFDCIQYCIQGDYFIVNLWATDISGISKEFFKFNEFMVGTYKTQYYIGSVGLCKNVKYLL